MFLYFGSLLIYSYLLMKFFKKININSYEYLFFFFLIFLINYSLNYIMRVLLLISIFFLYVSKILSYYNVTNTDLFNNKFLGNKRKEYENKTDKHFFLFELNEFNNYYISSYLFNCKLNNNNRDCFFAIFTDNLKKNPMSDFFIIFCKDFSWENQYLKITYDNVNKTYKISYTKDKDKGKDIEDKDMEVFSYKYFDNCAIFKILKKGDTEERLYFCSDISPIKDSDEYLSLFNNVNIEKIKMVYYKQVPNFLFYGCKNIKEIEFDTGEIKDIHPKSLFVENNNLKYLKINDFVLNCDDNQLFNCHSLIKIDTSLGCIIDNLYISNDINIYTNGYIEFKNPVNCVGKNIILNANKIIINNSRVDDIFKNIKIVNKLPIIKFSKDYLYDNSSNDFYQIENPFKNISKDIIDGKLIIEFEDSDTGKINKSINFDGLTKYKGKEEVATIEDVATIKEIRFKGKKIENVTNTRDSIYYFLNDPDRYIKFRTLYGLNKGRQYRLDYLSTVDINNKKEEDIAEELLNLDAKIVQERLAKKKREQNENNMHINTNKDDKKIQDVSGLRCCMFCSNSCHCKHQR